MSSSKNKLPLHLQIAVPVALVILGAVAMAGAALLENWRFDRAGEQISQLVDLMRATAAGQKTFAQNANEDLMAGLEHAGQIVPAHANPWQGQIRAVALSNAYMRLETEVPTHDCRRLAFYFIERGPAAIGLFGVEGAPVAEGANWAAIYPIPAAHPRDREAAQVACGKAPYAHLALVFSIR